MRKLQVTLRLTAPAWPQEIASVLLRAVLARVTWWGAACLSPMIGARARSATVKVISRETRE
jgi:hypothetical protein